MGLSLVLLGDSIAWGQGAAAPGERLAPRLVAGLAAAGADARADVVAVPGARSAHLARQVDRAAVLHPDLAVVVIGANDLTHRVPAERAAADLGRAVRRLREAGAEVVVAAAPDLSAVPHVPEPLRALVRAASEDLRSRQEDAVRAAGGRVADPEHRGSDAFADDPGLFSADRFHPSSAGYAVIAAALLPEVLRAAGLGTDAA
ncbi:GDSL-type esterase/lipase family protein [Nocardioides sp. SOB77]|uniref:GDSL-type esterase/lipase family protein n=1 Tax=Nocardioides oceani TaxID=3058369 RepID=A0ABT8FFT4_9ACTN|nr:GDSL-type esterase/lipase family protein [Nocardioides oceani]MDN4173533.1 GDSL-type esterase/lipase family protein [Nocardioides oceani]